MEVKEEEYEEPQEPVCKENQDYGMDCLARNLGLDIEALARSLAMNNDGRKPIQCLDVEDDPQDIKNQNAEMNGEPNGSLMKMQKVDDNEESKE
jgi:hypothetical protein